MPKKWDNNTNPPEKQVVFITNIDVKDPFVTFDRYDDRSLMENKLFREVKQSWHFEHPPYEVFMLANVPVRDREKELNITRDRVYTKYTGGQLIEKS